MKEKGKTIEGWQKIQEITQQISNLSLFYKENKEKGTKIGEKGEILELIKQLNQERKTKGEKIIVQVYDINFHDGILAGGLLLRR